MESSCSFVLTGTLPFRFLLLLSSHATFASASHLRLDLGDELEIGVLPDAAVTELAALNATIVRRIHILPTEVTTATSITFPNGDTLIRHGEPQILPDGYVNFDFADDGDGEADLTVNSDTGSVEGTLYSKDGASYLIKDVREEGSHHAMSHLWVEVTPLPMGGPSDVVMPPPDAEETRQVTVRSLEEEKLLAKGVAEGNTVAHISLKMYYTDKYQQVTADLQGAFDKILSVMNQGFTNSGVRIRVYLHCTELYSGEEIYGGTQMLTAFTRSKGTPKALLGSADMAMLMTSASNVGGVAFVGSASYPIGMCTKRGAESSFTFGHEVGHILGGDHDRHQLEKEGRKPIRSYAVGYLMQGTNKHSILAYGTSGYTRSINYYSGVGVYDASGDATGRREADNVRVLNERRFVVSAVGDESQKCRGGGGAFCKTTQGYPCVFPFTYNGVSYNQCTDIDFKDHPWCATNTDSSGNYASGKWGTCDTGTCCPTKSGKTCSFPFKYGGNNYDSCTKADSDVDWCSTKTDSGGNHIEGEWDYCGTEC